MRWQGSPPAAFNPQTDNAHDSSAGQAKSDKAEARCHNHDDPAEASYANDAAHAYHHDDVDDDVNDAAHAHANLNRASEDHNQGLTISPETFTARAPMSRIQHTSKATCWAALDHIGPIISVGTVAASAASAGFTAQEQLTDHSVATTEPQCPAVRPVNRSR